MEDDVSQTDEKKEDEPKAEETVEIKEKAKRQTKTDAERIKTTSIIEDARKAAKEIREANEETKQLQQQQEMLLAQQQLGGRAEAGQAPIPIKEESAIEYSQKVLTGEVNPLETNETS